MAAKTFVAGRIATSITSVTLVVPNFGPSNSRAVPVTYSQQRHQHHVGGNEVLETKQPAHQNKDIEYFKRLKTQNTTQSERMLSTVRVCEGTKGSFF